jgi:hypothetical protein
MLLCDDTGALPKMGSGDRESNNGIDPTAAIRGTDVGAITCRENSRSGRQREFTDGRLELSDSFAGLRICNVCTRHGHSFVSPGRTPSLATGPGVINRRTSRFAEEARRWFV